MRVEILFEQFCIEGVNHDFTSGMGTGLILEFKRALRPCFSCGYWS